MSASRPGLHRVVDGADGAGQTLVLLNSLGASTQMWDVVVAALVPSRPIIRMDYRGHGATPWDDQPFDFDELVADVVDALAAEHVHQFHVAGVSLGGMLALVLAARYPERVLSATPMCCGARLERSDWVRRGEFVRAEGMESLVDVVRPRWFTNKAQRENAPVVRRYLDDLLACDAGAYAAHADMLADVDLIPELPRLTASTTVVSAEEDIATPPVLQEVIASIVPGATRRVVGAAAHLVTAEAPVTVSEILATHLADIDGKNSGDKMSDKVTIV